MTLRLLSEYGKSFQLKVLGALLSDKKFILTVRDVLKDEYFDSPAHRWIVQQIQKYFDEYNTTISMEVLKIELQKVENDVLKISIKEELKNSYKASSEDRDFVEKEFADFCRNQEMKRAILESADLLKNGDYEGIRVRVENALKAGIEKSIGHEYKKDLESRYREDYRPTIASPWEPLNVLYSGGLGPGDLFLIFGGPGTGKSWLSIDYAAHAVELGYNVIYYTLELGENYVARRFDSVFTGYSIEDCAQHRDEVEKLMSELPGNLIIKEYPPKSATISTIKGHVQKCIDDGVVPNLIVIDYIDYLRPVARKSERKDEIDDVYVGAKGLAKELQIPVISPSQINRAGAKDEVVEGDKAAGSYDKLMVADGAVSLSRRKEDKVLGIARIHIMKNRYGDDGITYNVKMDTSNGKVEFEDQAESGVSVNSVNGGVYKLDRNVLANFFKNE